jgi:hypothetical protein
LSASRNAIKLAAPAAADGLTRPCSCNPVARIHADYADFDTTKSFAVCLCAAAPCFVTATTSRLNSSVRSLGMVPVLPRR